MAHHVHLMEHYARLLTGHSHSRSDSLHPMVSTLDEVCAEVLYDVLLRHRMNRRMNRRMSHSNTATNYTK
jgi:hypothetical protein